MNRLFVCLVLMAGMVGCPGAGDCDPANSPRVLPFYDTIMNTMQPLEYSGVQVMVKPQVTLTVDFRKHIWTLHNIHEYDAQGGVILEQGRYGLCAELSTYVYEKLKPMLSPRFETKFAMVTEPGFFSADQSNHIVLIMADKMTHEAYLIDPSFHKYARLKDLPEYHIFNIQDTLSFVKDQSHDISFDVDQAIPLYIKGDFLLSFSMTSVDGKFDQNNFLFAIAVNERGKFPAHDIFVLGRRNKEFQDFEEKALLERLLTPDEINTLFNKMNGWLKDL